MEYKDKHSCGTHFSRKKKTNYMIKYKDSLILNEYFMLEFS